ncbi:MAG: hypothetical protein GC206_14265 [Alphaproteobacteria bacterium]|nr:hypothetical protein [Alphaproteobacteria bacterium]
MRTLSAAVAAMFTLGAVAGADEPMAGAAQEDTPAYAVVDENASIPFAERRINSFRVGLDRSLILRVGASRFYRAELDDDCARDLRWEIDIGVRIPTAGALRRSDTVVIDGRRCFLRTLDEIADPRPVEQAARSESAAP